MKCIKTPDNGLQETLDPSMLCAAAKSTAASSAAELRRVSVTRGYNYPLVLLLLVLLASFAHAEQAVAVLDLRFIEDTGEPGIYMCEGDNDCVVWGTVYVFEAKVTRIVRGKLPREPFLVLYAQHALNREDFSNVVALLEKREGGGVSDARYRIVQWGEKRDMYCFDHRDDNGSDIEVELGDGERLNCYEPG